MSSSSDASPQLKASFLRAAQSANMARALEHIDIAEVAGKYPDAVTWRDEWGMTALSNAARNGQTGFVEILLARKSDVDARDNQGSTALILTAYNSASENRDVATLLLAAGADVNAANDEGKTPLMMASIGPFEEMMDILLRAGADPGMKDKAGMTSAGQIQSKYDRVTAENAAQVRSGSAMPLMAASEITEAMAMLAKAQAEWDERATTARVNEQVARIHAGTAQVTPVGKPLHFKPKT